MKFVVDVIYFRFCLLFLSKGSIVYSTSHMLHGRQLRVSWRQFSNCKVYKFILQSLYVQLLVKAALVAMEMMTDEE